MSKHDLQDRLHKVAFNSAKLARKLELEDQARRLFYLNGYWAGFINSLIELLDEEQLEVLEKAVAKTERQLISDQN